MAPFHTCDCPHYSWHRTVLHYLLVPSIHLHGTEKDSPEVAQAGACEFAFLSKFCPSPVLCTEKMAHACIKGSENLLPALMKIHCNGPILQGIILPVESSHRRIQGKW